MSLRSLISKIIPNSTPAHLRENTANIARDRLQVILSRERGSQSAHLSSAEFQQLSNQLLQVVGKYCKVNTDDVTVSVKRDGANTEIYEMQVNFPPKNQQQSPSPSRTSRP